MRYQARHRGAALRAAEGAATAAARGGSPSSSPRARPPAAASPLPPNCFVSPTQAASSGARARQRFNTRGRWWLAVVGCCLWTRPVI
jgi:hypothetical protein